VIEDSQSLDGNLKQNFIKLDFYHLLSEYYNLLILIKSGYKQCMELKKLMRWAYPH
jgi:hypothetical protein